MTRDRPPLSRLERPAANPSPGRRLLAAGTSLTVVALTAALLAAGPARAAGGGGGGGGGGSAGGSVAARADPDFDAGEAASKAGQWQEVLTRMGAVVQRDPNNADAWNYLGHAYRQLGQMDDSFKHYERALQIDPRHRGAHEYMGEAYLLVGDLAQAEVHLKALDKLCLFPCEEYSELKEKVADYKRDHPQQASR